MGREQSAKALMINDYNHKVPERNLSLIINERCERRRESRKGFTPELARMKADYLCGKFKSPQSRNFYLKCAWNLTDMCIDRLVAIALKKKTPAKYFAAAASNEMRS